MGRILPVSCAVHSRLRTLRQMATRCHRYFGGDGPESGLDRLDGTVFVLMILSRTAPSARLRASSTRYGAAAFGGHRSLTRSSTRTTQHPSDQGRPLDRKGALFE